MEPNDRPTPQKPPVPPIPQPNNTPDGGKKIWAPSPPPPPKPGKVNGLKHHNHTRLG